MASIHAKTEVTVSDILRAAKREEIRLEVIVSRGVLMKKNPGYEICRNRYPDTFSIPKGSVIPLSKSACEQLDLMGTASWREIDAYVPFRTIKSALVDFSSDDSDLHRYTAAVLDDGEQNMECSIDDCRISGKEIHALADAFLEDDVSISIRKPEQRHSYQENQILGVINEQGYSPMDLPCNKPGRRGIKSLVREKLKNDPAFTKKSFDLAWERLAKEPRRIGYALPQTEGEREACEEG